MSKAISYIRFSDPSQAKGDSYRRQLATAGFLPVNVTCTL